MVTNAYFHSSALLRNFDIEKYVFEFGLKCKLQIYEKTSIQRPYKRTAVVTIQMHNKQSERKTKERIDIANKHSLTAELTRICEGKATRYRC